MKKKPETKDNNNNSTPTEKMFNIAINDNQLQVPEGTSILNAAKMINVHIPTLCHHEDLCVVGNCRICVVEVENSPSLVAACATPVKENMLISTNSLKIRSTRKHILELLLTEHNINCIKCTSSSICELQELALEYRIDEDLYLNLRKPGNPDISSFSIQKDVSKCIRCTRCIRTCEQIQGVNALTMANKGNLTKLSTFCEKKMSDIVCTNCGQCINRCPTGALKEKSNIEEVWNAIYDTKKHVVVQISPSVRIAIGEPFGLKPGHNITGRIVAALKAFGFDSVFDTAFASDLATMEITAELLSRLKKSLVEKDSSASLPMFTSCSQGWVKLVEHIFPELIPNLSTCKSPQQMLGVLTKTYYAQKKGINPKDIVSVSIMPCTAKKYEANRSEMKDSGFQDVDFVITTREFARMIQQSGIKVMNLKDREFDGLMGETSRAGVIYDITGGVMESSIRTLYQIVTGKEITEAELDIKTLRGFDGIRETSVIIKDIKPEYKFLEGLELKFAVAHGLANARKLANMILDNNQIYHFVEIMACPGGCVGGGGQPVPTNLKILNKRIEAIDKEDETMKYPKAHENQEVKKLYEEFLGEPVKNLSHKLLHTYYTERNKY